MTKTLAASTRLLIAFIVSAPTLLAVFWLSQNGHRRTGQVLFVVLWIVGFLIVKRKPTTPTGSPSVKVELPSSTVWVIGAASFFGSLLLVTSGVRAHETSEIVGGCFGMLAAGLWVSFLRN